MCVKASSFFLLFLCFFMHASSPLPDTVSHSTILHTQKVKIEEKHNFNKFGSDERVTLLFMHSKGSKENICKKYKAINKEVDENSTAGTSGADCKFSHHKALLQLTKSQGSRWLHLNVKEMDHLQNEENLSETDYQSPHRKSPIHNK